MTQRYTDPLCLLRMSQGLCPECERPPELHAEDFYMVWQMFSNCNLLKRGVIERIDAYQQDLGKKV